MILTSPDLLDAMQMMKTAGLSLGEIYKPQYNIPTYME